MAAGISGSSIKLPGAILLIPLRLVEAETSLAEVCGRVRRCRGLALTDMDWPFFADGVTAGSERSLPLTLALTIRFARAQA